MTPSLRMRELVIEAHGQQYYDDHLVKVLHIAADFLPSNYKTFQDVGAEDVFAIALGHDLIEDTKTQLPDIGDQFGPLVMDVIWRLTDVNGFNNRKERKLATYPKIAASELATYAKHCDRLANIRRKGKIEMYRNEHPVYKAKLFNRYASCEAIEAEIEKELKRD